MRNVAAVEETKTLKINLSKSSHKGDFLRYLAKAIEQEKYEVCRELIEVAYDLGAEDWEVDYILKKHANRVVRAAGQVS